MIKQFIEKINNEEYISQTLYEFIKKNYQDQIPKNFNLAEYNNNHLEKQYIKYKEYFEDIYKRLNIEIPTKEKIQSILSDEKDTFIQVEDEKEKNSIIVSKVKYLVDIKKINPEKILVMSFTKKTTKQLEEKLYLDFNINANITAYHTLGYKYIKEKYKDKKCYAVDENLKDKIFYDYFEELFKNKDKMKIVINTFDNLFNQYFKDNYTKYKTYQDYFKECKKYIITNIPNIEELVTTIINESLNEEKIYTIKGELVKTKAEAIIGNFLSKNNIKYDYEQIDEQTENHQTTKSFFVINTQKEKVYITYGKNEIENDNIIEIDCPTEEIIKTLIQGLTKYNISHSKKTDEEIYEMILDQDPYEQINDFKNMIQETIELIKSSSKRTNYKQIIINYINTLKGNERNESSNEAVLIIDYYEYYEERLTKGETYGYDFSDLLYYANIYLDQVEIQDSIEYAYIIIDKYQDIEEDKYEFIKNIAQKTGSKIISIGMKR